MNMNLVGKALKFKDRSSYEEFAALDSVNEIMTRLVGLSDHFFVRSQYKNGDIMSISTIDGAIYKMETNIPIIEFGSELKFFELYEEPKFQATDNQSKFKFYRANKEDLKVVKDLIDIYYLYNVELTLKGKGDSLLEIFDYDNWHGNIYGIECDISKYEDETNILGRELLKSINEYLYK